MHSESFFRMRSARVRQWAGAGDDGPVMLNVFSATPSGWSLPSLTLTCLDMPVEKQGLTTADVVQLLSALWDSCRSSISVLNMDSRALIRAVAQVRVLVQGEVAAAEVEVVLVVALGQLLGACRHA